MVAKVGQPQAASTVAPARAAAVNHVGPTGLARQVDGLNGSNRPGPQEEALRFSDTWEDLHHDRHDRRRRRDGRDEDPVRFGDVLTTEEVSSALMAYRAQHDVTPIRAPSLATSLYENAMRAISGGGSLRMAGETLNRLL